jgi:hypothetical protein
MLKGIPGPVARCRLSIRDPEDLINLTSSIHQGNEK